MERIHYLMFWTCVGLLPIIVFGIGITTNIFLVLVVIATVINISDEEMCTFNNEQNELIFKKKSIFGGINLYKTALDHLESVQIEACPGKKSLFRISFRFGDGVCIPMTNGYFHAKARLDKLAQKISDTMNVEHDAEDAEPDSADIESDSSAYDSKKEC